MRKLGNSNINVSQICLGTMTWGQQNTQQEAFSQMDYAFEHGINFMDAAELYPVPPAEETSTRTEQIIGHYFSERKNREKVILATKIAGPSAFLKWIRGGKLDFSPESLKTALEASLKRLQTEYIDLYQLHWPARKTNFFGQRGYKAAQDDLADIAESTRRETEAIEAALESLTAMVKEGKIRHIGLSNETPWGLSTFLRLAEQKGYSRIVSVQNPYSLLNRTYEVGMAEMSLRENCGLLAYSPLGFGVLSGKYSGGQKPEKARLTLFGNHFSRYTKPRPVKATERYVHLARENNISAATMALAFVNSRPFLTSNIIGATSLEQLKENIASAEVRLDKELLKKIDEIHEEIPNPAP